MRISDWSSDVCSSDLPARQIDVAALGGAELLLDRDHLLLRDEAVPADERLGVVGGIGGIGGPVGAHDARGVAADGAAGPEAVLRPHAADLLRPDRVPSTAQVPDEWANLARFFPVRH